MLPPTPASPTPPPSSTPVAATALQAELRRLYRDRTGAADGRVRGLVLELTGPPDWRTLAPVWQGVQAELALPAPGIAVSGVDGLQLWFALAEPVTLARGQAFLQGLVARFLPDIAAGRLRLLPAEGRPLPPVPARQATTGNWSAFLAPDLAPVFADTPWLDVPPGEEGQTALLRALAVMPPAAFDAASARLSPVPAGAPTASASQPAGPARPLQALAPGAVTDPRQFLLRVMNDETLPMAQRIDAARALLSAHPGGQPVEG
ncbi:hypothetical protein GN316_14445 [Xylophilus sp. Kf1]|nr:hypothetical protein [Xylophilus sp. Kf1]